MIFSSKLIPGPLSRSGEFEPQKAIRAVQSLCLFSTCARYMTSRLPRVHSIKCKTHGLCTFFIKIIEREWQNMKCLSDICRRPSRSERRTSGIQYMIEEWAEQKLTIFRTLHHQVRRSGDICSHPSSKPAMTIISETFPPQICKTTHMFFDITLVPFRLFEIIWCIEAVRCRGICGGCRCFTSSSAH